MDRGTKPLVAIVGQPNVGKSTLFNRISGNPTSIVSDIPGTTRDRIIADVNWGDSPFILVDTGGLLSLPEDRLWQQIKGQIDVAIEEADIIIMVVDANNGITASDRDVADILRRTSVPVLLTANKSDNETRKFQAGEFYELGLGEPITISAYHNLGIEDLMSAIISNFPEATLPVSPFVDLKLAIVGRTNVGKSMLLNAITGQDRAIVSDIPGTTRDAINTQINYEGQTIILVDTAGIRRRGKIDPGIEQYSVLRAIRSIDRADVAILVMDASEPATSQDTHVASYILNAYKGIVLAVNKWDLANRLDITKDLISKKIEERFKFAPYAPVNFISALRNSGIAELMNATQRVYNHWSKEVPRYDLRRTVLNAVASHPPSFSGRKTLKIFGVSQDRTRPPSFTFYVNRSDMVHFSYQRYLENRIREAYGFEGSPLKMRFKGQGEN